MANGIFCTCTIVFFHSLDKAGVVEKSPNGAKLNDSGGKRLILNMNTMHKPGCSKGDSTCVFQIMVFSIAGTVARVITIEEANNVVVDIFDKQRVKRRIDQQ